MPTDTNIFWSEIPKDATIYDLGASWVAQMPDGKTSLVYWTGNEAAKAQSFLKMKAIPGPIRPITPRTEFTQEQIDKIKADCKKHESPTQTIVMNFGKTYRRR